MGFCIWKRNTKKAIRKFIYGMGSRGEGDEKKAEYQIRNKKELRIIQKKLSISSYIPWFASSPISQQETKCFFSRLALDEAAQERRKKPSHQQRDHKWSNRDTSDIILEYLVSIVSYVLCETCRSRF